MRLVADRIRVIPTSLAEGSSSQSPGYQQSLVWDDLQKLLKRIASPVPEYGTTHRSFVSESALVVYGLEDDRLRGKVYEDVYRIICAATLPSPPTAPTHQDYWSEIRTPNPFSTSAYSEEDRHTIPVHEFVKGVSEESPSDSVVAMAFRIVRAAHQFTVDPLITFDDEGGELDFHMRLRNGLLVMADIFLDGSIDASVYDDSHSGPVRTIKRLRRRDALEKDIIDLFREGLHARTA